MSLGNPFLVLINYLHHMEGRSYQILVTVAAEIHLNPSICERFGNFYHNTRVWERVNITGSNFVKFRLISLQLYSCENKRILIL